MIGFGDEIKNPHPNFLPIDHKIIDQNHHQDDPNHIFSDSLDELLKNMSPSVTDEKRKAIEEFFWWLEELKVSVFAQELKTAIPMSKKRLKKKLEEIKRMGKQIG